MIRLILMSCDKCKADFPASPENYYDSALGRTVIVYALCPKCKKK